MQMSEVAKTSILVTQLHPWDVGVFQTITDAIPTYFLDFWWPPSVLHLQQKGYNIDKWVLDIIHFSYTIQFFSTFPQTPFPDSLQGPLSQGDPPTRGELYP